MSESDSQLLQRFVREDSQEAFTEVVNRHLDLVYSVALRQVRSSHLAQEVAQSVFLDLARACRRTTVADPVSAWLYIVARRTAIDVVRRETRRQARERVAVEISAMNHPDSDWSRIEPALDEAMAELSPHDRGAIVLRFFENKSLRDVGAALDASENAAQKRIARALEQLRTHFTRRGIAVSSAALAAGLSGHALQAAPIGLTAAIAASATANSVAAAGTFLLMSTSTVKTSAVIVVLAAGAVGLLVQHRANDQLHAEVDSLRTELAASGRRSVTNFRSANAVAAADQTEIAHLRAEVERLGGTLPPPDAATAAWAGRMAILKQRMAQQPEQSIPELRLVTDDDWLDASKNNLETEEEFRTAMADIRNYAEGTFAGKIVQPALKRYLQANANQFPSDWTQLQPYFDQPVEAAILARWMFVPASAIPGVREVGDQVITPKDPVDPMHDHRRVVGVTSQHLTSWPIKIGPVEYPRGLAPVLTAYRAANGGQDPVDPIQIQPYATTPSQQALLQGMLSPPQLGPASR